MKQIQANEKHRVRPGSAMSLIGPRRGTAMACVVAVLILLASVVAPAWGDEQEAVPGQPYPLSEVEEAGMSNKELISQLIDTQTAKELPHRDIDRGEAVELAEGVFGPLLESSAGPFGDLHVEKFLADNAAIVSPGQPDAAVIIGGEGAAEEEAQQADGPLLLESTLPLRTENDSGQDRLVDLDLEREEKELQATNPLVEVGIPDELGDGIELPSGSLELVTSAAAEERAPSILADNLAFYPNVAKDTDFAVATTPTGIETFALIRSTDSPESQTLHLGLEEGTNLEETPEGGAVAMSGTEEALKVMPPVAVDASGQSVPVSLEVSGDSLILSVATDESTAFPVLLDPVIVESWEWNALNGNKGLGGSNGAWAGAWKSWRNTLAYSADPYVPWATAPNPLYYKLPGLTMTSGWQSSVEAGAQANWNYYVPRYFTDYEKFGTRPTSFIQNVQMWNLQYHAYSSQASPWLAAGLWDEQLWKWVSVYSRNGTEGSIGEKYWTYLYNFPNPGYVQSAKNAGIALLSSEAGANNGRILYDGYAAVSLNDLTKPSIGEFFGNSKWMNTEAAEAVKVTASDSGLGMKYLRWVGEGGGENYLTQLYCQGGVEDPCYRTWNATWKGYPATSLSTGIHFYTVTAFDVLGNESAEHPKIPVKIDHTAPSLTLSGTMTQQAFLGYKSPQYVLHLGGSDGTSGAPQAGIASSEVTVDGKVVDSTKAGCATQNCSLSRDWTLKSEAYSTGEHKVVASVTDGAGNTTTKSLTIKIEADTTAPTLETFGTLVTAPDGWVEQVSRTATAYAEDVNGYGVTSLTFTIDGKLIKSATGTCEAGGCERYLSASVSMAGYAAGAHSAEIAAKDGAGNVSKKAWTINVNPSGTVPSSEAAKTLEASDATSESTTVAPTSEVVEPAEREDGNDPSLTVEGSSLASSGTAVESSMTIDAGNGYTLDGGEESFHIEPTESSASETNIEVKSEVAGVAANTAGGVDAVVRPLYDGIQAFQSIRQSTAPETYSWKVQLHTGQSLEAIDETHAGIYYPELELLAMTITAETAHDATGKAVPTSLSVSEGQVLTLTVKHKGGGFVYPVTAGSTWQTGYETIIVKGPPTKQEEEQAEAEAAMNDPEVLAAISAPQFVGCPDTEEACASSSAPYKTYAFKACSSAPLVGCTVWEEKIRGFFYYNGSQAWMSKRQPNCSHQAGPTFSVSEDYCIWVGPDHQPYGDGYHITSQVRFNVSALQVQVTSQKHLTVRMYGSGNPYVTSSPNICNPSKPSCA